MGLSKHAPTPLSAATPFPRAWARSISSHDGLSRPQGHAPTSLPAGGFTGLFSSSPESLRAT